MFLDGFEKSFGCALAAGASYYPLRYQVRVRRIWISRVLLVAVLFSPLLVPRWAPLVRFAATLVAITISVKLYDLPLGADSEQPQRFFGFLAYLLHPFALVWAKRPVNPASRRDDVLQLTTGLLLAHVTVGLLVAIFRVDWRRHSFALEHCTKLIAVFLFVLVATNAMAAAFRLAGQPAMNFCGNFFFARTPAEFWRLYNRPVCQFFYEHVFKPLDGRRRPIRATLLTFGISGIIHEYVFDISAGRIFGLQMAFFLIQGVAAALTLRLRPRGFAALVGVALTLAFNLATGLLFFACMNALFPFYAAR